MFGEALRDLQVVFQDWQRRAKARPQAAIWGAVLVVGLLLAYGRVLIDWANVGLHMARWHHILLAPIAAGAAWLIVYRRGAPAEEQVRPAWFAGGVCFLVALLFRVAEAAVNDPNQAYDGVTFGGLSIVATVCGLMLWLQGWQRLKRFSWAVGLLVFAVPLFGTLVAAVALPLQHVSAAGTEVVCRVLGLDVTRQGYVLNLGTTFEAQVVDQCSGMDSLFAVLLVGTWIAGSGRLSLVHKAGMLLLLPPVTILANVLRLVIMMVCADLFGSEVAMSFFHELSDLVLFLVMVSAMLAARAYLERPRGGPMDGRALAEGTQPDALEWVWTTSGPQPASAEQPGPRRF